MKTVKKILAGVLAMTTLFSVGFTASCKNVGENAEHNAFIKELGGTSETYKGAVSPVAYETEAEAIEKCVATEIAGNGAKIVNTTKKELSSAQIANLSLPATETEGMLGVEEVEVEYSLLSNGTKATGTLNENKTVKIYIIKFENRFKYYTPCPVNGETITQSYYDSVFNSENYKNCTLNTTMEMSMDMTNGTEVVSMLMKMTQFVKYSESGIYMEQNAEISMEMNSSSNENDIKMWAYIAKTETGIDCYVSQDGEEWIKGSLIQIGFSSIDDLLPFADQYLDYTYFTKSDYGFELTNENAKQYLSETLEQVGQYLGEDTVIEMFAKYYVCNGALSGMRMDMKMDINMTVGNETVTGKATAVAESKVTDYGTTVVEKPFD